MEHASPVMYVANVGSVVLLKCDFVNWNPGWRLSWYKDGKVIRRKSKYTFRSGALSFLRIEDVLSKDSGVYECLARSECCTAGKRLNLTVSGKLC